MEPGQARYNLVSDLSKPKQWRGNVNIKNRSGVNRFYTKVSITTIY